MKNRAAFIFSVCLLFAFSGSPSAQELPPPPDDLGEAMAEEGTDQNLWIQDEPPETPPAEADGAPAPNNEDLFLPDPGEELTETGEDTGRGTHLLKFEFISKVQFVNIEKTADGLPRSRDPYMEVQYANRFQATLNLGRTRNQLQVDAEYDVDNWGSLAKNELFDCRLDIALQELPVEVITKLPKQPENPEEPPAPRQLAIQINFNKDGTENWFSFCTDISGSQLNTQGDTEEYNYKTLEMVEPSLRAVLIEDFDPSKGAKVGLSVPHKAFTDTDIVNDIIVSGEGSLEIEPIE